MNVQAVFDVGSEWAPYGGANLSEDQIYRYLLFRYWVENGDFLNFVMLNPSTADALVDDPTIRRCIGFAKREGFGGITVTNLYALRATDPRQLRGHADPVGPENLRFFQKILDSEMPICVAWGAGARSHAAIQSPVEGQLMDLAMSGADVRCLGVTKNGYPRHPLYLSNDTPMVNWNDACNG